MLPYFWQCRWVKAMKPVKIKSNSDLNIIVLWTLTVNLSFTLVVRCGGGHGQIWEKVNNIIIEMTRDKKIVSSDRARVRKMTSADKMVSQSESASFFGCIYEMTPSESCHNQRWRPQSSLSTLNRFLLLILQTVRSISVFLPHPFIVRYPAPSRNRFCACGEISW